MKLKVLFFGATAEVAGCRSIEMDTPMDSSSRVAFEQVIQAHPALAGHKLLFSLNQQYASGSERLAEGDELAVFTAVSGG